MTRLERALHRLTADLDELAIHWAIVGGLAINVYADPRTTQDIDLAIAVDSDKTAEQLTRTLCSRGYRHVYSLEQEARGRLAAARLELHGEAPGVALDLLFASSGIESEIAQDALPLEILPGFVARVARIGHLLALKILAGREIDQRDARVLLGLASADELARARSVIDLIAHRGFNRGKDLGAEFDRLRESSGPRRSG